MQNDFQENMNVCTESFVESKHCLFVYVAIFRSFIEDHAGKVSGVSSERIWDELSYGILRKTFQCTNLGKGKVKLAIIEFSG